MEHAWHDMRFFTGSYISVIIPLLVWFVINAMVTYRRHYDLYDGVYKLGNRTLPEVLFYNDFDSSGGFNKPTGCIVFLTAAYAFCWLFYFILHYIIY